MFIIFKIKNLKFSSLFDCLFNNVLDFLINKLKNFILTLIINAFKFKTLFLMLFIFANIVFLNAMRVN